MADVAETVFSHACDPGGTWRRAGGPVARPATGGLRCPVARPNRAATLGCAKLRAVAETHFDERIAPLYETLWPEIHDAVVVDAAVDLLAALAGPGPILEFGVGTGRIARPLSRRGVHVHGIELSPAMAAELKAREGGRDVAVTVGDFATTRVDGTFTLVYLVANTITNLTTQEEQVACFRNAAAHLGPGGLFVIENYVPALQRLAPGETTHLFAATPTHVGFEEYDPAGQIAVSHHWWDVDGRLIRLSSPHRYLWPAELDLMARLAGLALRERQGGWRREPFTAESRSHVSVWEKA